MGSLPPVPKKKDLTFQYYFWAPYRFLSQTETRKYGHNRKNSKPPHQTQAGKTLLYLRESLVYDEMGT